MGKIGISNSFIQGSLSELEKALNSNFTTFLDETPILVDYYNINDIMSTADTGYQNADAIIGEESPTRFNKIKNFPIYGLRPLIPDLETIDGGLIDMSISGEVVTLPNTIRPTPGDYFFYKQGGRSLTFIVTSISLGTIRSNDYYKLEISMKKIDEHNYDKVLDKQVVENFVTDIDLVGSNEKCIIKSTNAERIELYESILKDLILRYNQMFYCPKYNAMIMRKGLDDRFNYYDPFLTEFIIRNNVLDGTRDFMVLINLGKDHHFNKYYNMTLYRNIETKNKLRLVKNYSTPTTFPRSISTPFNYYGEEVFFNITLYQDDRIKIKENEYMKHDLLDNISCDHIVPSTPIIDTAIIRYLNKENVEDVLTEDEVKNLVNYDIDYDDYHFTHVPILIYILKQHIKALKK